MTREEISQHVELEMTLRRLTTFVDGHRYMPEHHQHDQHVWAWLVHELKLWGDAHPITIVEPAIPLLASTTVRA